MSSSSLDSFLTDQVELGEKPQLDTLARQIGKNTLWLVASRLGAQGLMLIFTLLIARRLGEAGLGAYAFMAALILLGNTLTTFGTDMLIIREVADKKDLSLVPAGLILQMILSILFIAGLFLVAPAFPNQSLQAVQALKIFSLALIPMAFYSIFSAVLRGYERMDLFTSLNLALALLQVGLVWLLIQPGASLVRLAWLLLASQSLTAALAGWICFAQLPPIHSAWRTSLAAILALVRSSAPIALLGLLKVLYQRTAIYLLAALAGASVTGWYSAALRLVEASQIGHVALLGALFPLMSRYQNESQIHSRAERIFRRSWWGLLTLGTGLALALYLLAPFLIRSLYGSAFEPAVLALRFLAWLMIPYSVNIYLSSRFLAARRERQVGLALALGLIVMTGLSLFWIPRWGLSGASLAALVAETVQAALLIALDQLDRPRERN